MKYGVAISQENLGQEAPVLFHGDLAVSMGIAADMGFDCVEWHIRNPSSMEISHLKKAASVAGVSVAAIGTGLEFSKNSLSLSSVDREIRRQTVNRFYEYIELASEFGAVVFVGLCRGKAPSFEERELYLNILEESLHPIVTYAEKRQVVLGLEPIAFYLTNLLNTTDETIRFANRFQSDAMKLLLDTHHMFIEDHDIANAIRLSQGEIAHIHISDSNRRYPGSGNINYAEVFNVLKEIGYDRAACLEIIPYPDAKSAARNGLLQMRKYA